MRLIFIIICLFAMLQSCDQGESKMHPPIADKVSHNFEIQGQKIHDDYAWLRDPKWPAVTDKKILGYLESENKYYEQFFSPMLNEKEKIFEELKGRIKLEDQSVYVKKDNYYYYSRTESDKEYPIYCRKLGGMDSVEETLLNVNELAKDKDFTKLGAFSISPDHKLMAYSVDFAGDERYTIRIYDLEFKKYLDDEIAGTIGNVVWHEKLNGFFYTPTNENWRHDKVMFHNLGEDLKNDTIVFHEPDVLYNVGVGKSSSKEYIFINVTGHDTNEIHIISMNDLKIVPKLVRKREEKIYYDLEHSGDYFYIKTNLKAKNFRVARVPVSDFQNNDWSDYVKEEDKYLSSFDSTKDYLILNYLDRGLPFIKIIKFNDLSEKVINFPDAAFTAESFSTNFDENDIRVGYSSLARPSTIYSYNFDLETLSILKVQEIPSGFSPDEYMVERVWSDNKGVKIPITLFYKKSLFKKDGSNPLYLYGYGSYGIGVAPAFRNSAVSLANRGFVFAIAHIRGGDDLGQDWYEAAKFLTKKLTFEDFISASKYLIEQKYTSKGNIVICGGSAGGLLIGNVINTAPDLFKAAIAHVPFVDLVNTMLDETLPLTPSEFKEWGNPKDPIYFEYMKSYDPYLNVKAQNYPDLMVTAGISDPRVGYWEAAKWVAKLRAQKTDTNTIILKTNMSAGHAGASGRFDYLKEAADDLVFILKVFGKN